MLKDSIRHDKLFNELTPVANGLGMIIVDVYKNIKSPTETQVCITAMSKEGLTGIDELAVFHRSCQALLELEIGREILSMEVSSPGVQRVFKDYYEFSVFEGKRCRVYSTSFSSWIEGDIGFSDAESVEIHDCTVIDNNEKHELLKLDFSDIQKAKLEYKWEK